MTLILCYQTRYDWFDEEWDIDEFVARKRAEREPSEIYFFADFVAADI